jgi:hypothetical protein
VYVIYWTKTVPRHTPSQMDAWYHMTGEMFDLTETVDVVMSKRFDTTEMSAALEFSESLRKRRKEGELLSFITMASEHPDSVGQLGVSDKLPEGYDWSKQDRAGKPRRR